MTAIKQCSRCKTPQAVTCFYRRSLSRSKDGLEGVCKRCLLNDQKCYKERNREKVLARKRLQGKERSPESRSAEYQRRKVAGLIDKVRMAASKKRFRAKSENKEKLRAAHRAWRLANVEHVRAKRLTEYARKVGAGGHVSAEEWAAIKAEYQYTCLACFRSEPEITLTRDHVVPLNKKGQHVIANIQPLCHSCNSRKQDRYIVDYRYGRELMSYWLNMEVR